MKGVLYAGFVLCGVLSASAAFAEEPLLTLLGAGTVVTSSPYDGVGVSVLPVPFMAWEHKGFYIRGIEAGYSFYEHGGLKLSAVTSPRMMGYSSEDSDALSGMEDRRRSLDAGFRAELALPFVTGLSVNAKVLNDVLSRSNGQEGELSLEQFYGAKYLRLRLSGGVKVQSSRLTNYYYGVRTAEARPGRQEYKPGTAVDPFLGVMLTTGFSENWLVITRLGVDLLDPAIRKSPIVDKSYTMMGMVGVVRRF
ncbi:MAG: MipA/OmpV family protein [Candidatus Omnitrophota bacterium]